VMSLNGRSYFSLTHGSDDRNYEYQVLTKLHIRCGLSAVDRCGHAEGLLAPGPALDLGPTERLLRGLGEKSGTMPGARMLVVSGHPKMPGNLLAH
jgi:hypothetical protein